MVVILSDDILTRPLWLLYYEVIEEGGVAGVEAAKPIKSPCCNSDNK